LLDEIGELLPRTQLKLLRVLQEKEFERVGEAKSVRVDVRVIACTNQDLRKKVEMKEFREDLYYRLKVVELHLPPLRERAEDIPLLVTHFCAFYEAQFKKNVHGVSDQAMEALMNYPWPGNIRELKHAIERALIFCHGNTISMEHLPPEVKEYSGASVCGQVTELHEQALDVITALSKSGWNKAKAARMLGITRPTLYKRISSQKLSESG
jgi:DNA-binding NtrC family response regulator